MKKKLFHSITFCLLILSASAFGFGGYGESNFRVALSKIQNQAQEAGRFARHYTSYVESQYEGSLTPIDLTPSINSPIVDTIDIEDGVITINFKNDNAVAPLLKGGKIELFPIEDGGQESILYWECDTSDADLNPFSFPVFGGGPINPVNTLDYPLSVCS